MLRCKTKTSRLVRHPARKRSESILTTRSQHGANTDVTEQWTAFAGGLQCARFCMVS